MSYLQAWKYLKEKDPLSIEKGLTILKQHVELNSLSSKAWFELAGAYDYLGREAEALPCYEKVFDLGIEMLSKDDHPRLYIQMGSTLRNLKQYERAVQLLKEGLEKFPNNQALEAFLALTEYSAGDSKKAIHGLIEDKISLSSDRYIQEYRRVLLFYAKELSKDF